MFDDNFPFFLIFIIKYFYMENYLKVFNDNDEYTEFEEKPIFGHIVTETNLKQVFIINYTATSKLVENQNLISGFNTPIIGHSFNNGNGKLYFNYKVSAIYKNAFSGSSLTGIEIPNTINSIGTQAFVNCKNLNYVKMPDTLKSIPERCFMGCLNIKRINSDVDGVVNLPLSLETVMGEAFESSFSSNTAVSVNIPYGVNYIGGGAFANCGSVRSWVIPESVTTLESAAFAQCVNVTSVTIPSSIEVIKRQLFRDYTKLERVVIPEGIKGIETRAFGQVLLNSSSLGYIELPSTIEYIDFGAFCDNGRLSDATVIIHALTPPTLDSYQTGDIFPKNSKIYVPAESVNAYKSATGWWDYYRNRIYPIE